MRTSLVLLVLVGLSCGGGGGDDSTPPADTSGGDGAADGPVADSGPVADGTNLNPDASGTSDAGGLCSDQNEACGEQQPACCGDLFCCAGVPVPPGQEYCSDMCPRSDVHAKEGFASIDPDDVLRRVKGLEISTWAYKDEPGVRHLGPMAQDFAAAFGLGATDTRIYTVDENGVNMAAIQALANKVDALEAENAALRARVQKLERKR